MAIFKVAVAALVVAVASGLKHGQSSNVSDYSDEVQLTDDVLAMFGEQLIAFQVGQEAQQARRYLDLVMKLQIAYYQSSAAQLFVNKMYVDYQAKHGRGAAVPGMGAFGASFLETSVETTEDADGDFLAAEGEQTGSEENEDVDNVPDDDDETTRKLEEDIGDEKPPEHAELHSLNKAGTASHQLQLLGSLNLFHAIKLLGTSCIYKAHDLQESFYAERALQLKVGLFGTDMFPPEVLSLIYMVMVSSYLKTQSLSLALQTVSTFTTYLEDELDYGTTVVGTPSRVSTADGFMGEELADDKLWAFSAFSKYSGLELTIFCIDYYVNYQAMQMFGAEGSQLQAEQQARQHGGAAASAARMNVMSKMPPPSPEMMRMFQTGPLGGAAGAMGGMANPMMMAMGGPSAAAPRPGATAFLEVGAETETHTEAKAKTKFFAALFAPFLLGGSFDLYTSIYTFYQLTMQYMSANAGLQSAYAHKAALQTVDAKHFNSLTPAKAMEHSKLMFGSFASNLQQVANVGYITAMWEMYGLYQESQVAASSDPFQAAQQQQAMR